MIAKSLAALGSALLIFGASPAGIEARTLTVVPHASTQRALTSATTRIGSVKTQSGKSRSGVHPYGFYWVAFSDPECPDSPDSFHRMVRYRDEYYTEYAEQFGGNSLYYCGSVVKQATYEQPYTDCTNSEYGCALLY